MSETTTDEIPLEIWAYSILREKKWSTREKAHHHAKNVCKKTKYHHDSILQEKDREIAEKEKYIEALEKHMDESKAYVLELKSRITTLEKQLGGKNYDC